MISLPKSKSGTVRRTGLSVAAALWAWLSPVAHAQAPLGGSNSPPTAETVVLPQSVPDPIEPFNRIVWAFNNQLMAHVAKPTSRVYRAVVAKPARNAISNLGKNLTYPDRLINNVLQGKWAGARDESYRFLCNTVLGVGGLFDVATRWEIPKSEADFGQTFGQWGWRPKCYLVLPIFGPSNERDALGLAADDAANPLDYLSPYSFDAGKPLSWLSPYEYFTSGVMYNNLADSVDEYVRFSRAEMDPYAEMQYAWTFVRENRVANFRVEGKQDDASLETLESVFFTFKNPEFPNHAKTRAVLIPATGRRLNYTFWLQPGQAPIVYIIPGLGSHRLAQASLALAELVYQAGYSAVCISSPFNSEFMTEASTAALPAYLPVDGHDLHVALTMIDRDLLTRFPNRLEARSLMGYSMGAFESLYVAAEVLTNQSPLLKFDRYVAINPPVRLAYGISKLDEFYRAPLAWPPTERTTNLANTFLKVADLSRSTLTPEISLPFNAVESKFLIGLAFRLMLRDIIFTSQQHTNQGILQHPIRPLRRDAVYQEILQYSYRDYFEKFAVPYYQGRGMADAENGLQKAGDLRSYAAELRARPNIRILVNQNDFLLAREDLAWLRGAFSTQQLTIFTEGGHLGNLYNPVVQKAILGALSGLPAPPAPVRLRR